MSTQRLTRVGVINTSYLVAQSLLFVVMTPVMIHALGGEAFGLWTILLGILSVAGLASFGVGTAVVKHVAEFSVADDAGEAISAVITFSATISILAGVVVSSSLWMLRHWFAALVIGESAASGALADALGVTAIGITPLLVSQVPRGVLLGLVHNEIAGGILLAQNAILLVGAATIAVARDDIVVLAAWCLLTNFLALFAHIYAVHLLASRYALHFAWRPRYFRIILGYSFYIWMTTLGSTLFNSLDRILVGVVLGPAAAGAYGVCTAVAMRINLFASALAQALTPFSSTYMAMGRHLEIERVFRRSLRLIACLVAALGSILYIWSDVLLSLWIGQDFAAAYSDAFRILVVAYAVFSMASPGWQVAQGMGRPEIPAIAGVAAGTVTLAMIVVAAPALGIAGAAAANFGYIIVLAVNYFVAREIGGKSPASVFSSLAPPLLVMMALLVFVQPNRLSLVAATLLSIASIVLITYMAVGWRDIRPNIVRLTAHLARR